MDICIYILRTSGQYKTGQKIVLQTDKCISREGFLAMVLSVDLGERNCNFRESVIK